VKTTKIDIESAIPEGELLDSITSTRAKEQLAKELIDSHRERADRAAREIGGTVRTDWKPQWYIRRGSHVTFGGDFILAASRWQVNVPNNFDPREAATSASAR
jgi:hypothetical protein